MIRRNLHENRAGHPRRLLVAARARVAAAFRKLAHGVDPRTAGARTRNFYRSSGMAWSRSLS